MLVYIHTYYADELTLKTSIRKVKLSLKFLTTYGIIHIEKMTARKAAVTLNLIFNYFNKKQKKQSYSRLKVIAFFVYLVIMNCFMNFC